MENMDILKNLKTLSTMDTLDNLGPIDTLYIFWTLSGIYVIFLLHSVQEWLTICSILSIYIKQCVGLCVRNHLHPPI